MIIDQYNFCATDIVLHIVPLIYIRRFPLAVPIYLKFTTYFIPQETLLVHHLSTYNLRLPILFTDGIPIYVRTYLISLDWDVIFLPAD